MLKDPTLVDPMLTMLRPLVGVPVDEFDVGVAMSFDFKCSDVRR
jgi:hypothetical protein